MDNRILLGGAAVLLVGAAFGGGYYLNHPSMPAAPPPVTQTLPQTEVVPPQAAAPAATPVTEPAPTVVAAAPVVKKRRLPDYASGETAYGPPPPPPPPPPRDFGGRPNPFEGRFATFPMRHAGAGTLASPLTWTAQTEFGNGHEADLRISVVVPTPPPGDRGEFWSQWSSRGRDDVMPDVTRGTPVVVAASASVVVAIDPQFLDLDAPAILTVNGRDGQRIYRSRDVAPARGESWNAQGARWIFQPDADFFRMMRDGANVSVMLRSRVSENPIAVPFSTDDLPPSLNGFERDLYMRIPGIAAAWERARPGAPPPPPPQAANPPNGYPPPRPNNPPPFGGPGYGQPHGPMPQQGYAPPHAPPASAPPPPPAQQSGNGDGYGPGDHRHDHGGPNEASAPPAAAKPNPPPAPTAPANPAPPSHPIAPPHAVVTPPAKPVPVVPPPAPPKAAAANPGVAMITAEVAAYRPPAENCGPQPPLPQTPGPSPERKQAKIWLKCRAQWIDAYKKSITVLGRDAVKQGAPLQTVNGGNAVVDAYMKAQGAFNAQKAVIKP